MKILILYYINIYSIFLAITIMSNVKGITSEKHCIPLIHSSP